MGYLIVAGTVFGVNLLELADVVGLLKHPHVGGEPLTFLQHHHIPRGQISFPDHPGLSQVQHRSDDQQYRDRDGVTADGE